MILYKQKLFNKFEKKVISAITDFNKRGVRKFIEGKGYKNLTNRDSVRMKDAIVAMSDFIEKKRNLSPQQIQSISTLLKNAGVTNTEEEAAKQLRILQRKYKNKDALVRLIKKKKTDPSIFRYSDFHNRMSELDRLQQDAISKSNKEREFFRDGGLGPENVISIRSKIFNPLNKRGVETITSRNNGWGNSYISTPYVNKKIRHERNVDAVLDDFDLSSMKRKIILDNKKSKLFEKSGARNGYITTETSVPATWVHEGGHGFNDTNLTPKQRRILKRRFFENEQKIENSLENGQDLRLRDIARFKLNDLNQLREELQASTRGYKNLEKVINTMDLSGVSKKEKEKILKSTANDLTRAYHSYSTEVAKDLEGLNIS